MMNHYQGILAEEIELHSNQSLEQEEELARHAHEHQFANAQKDR